MASYENSDASRRHTQFQKLKELGVEADRAHLAAMVYAEMCGSEEWSDVQLEYSEEQHRAFVIGRRGGAKDKTNVVPMGLDEEMSFAGIGRLLNLNGESNSMVVAFCEADGTIVYYGLKKGMWTACETKAEEVQEDADMEQDAGR